MEEMNNMLALVDQLSADFENLKEKLNSNK